MNWGSADREMAEIKESSRNVSTYNATNVTFNDPFVGVEIGPVARAFFIAIGSVEIISGTVGSCMLLTVLFTSRSLGMRSFHYMFIANLALADLLSMGYWLSFFVLDLILGYHPVVNKAHCVANGFLICFSAVVAMLSLTFISMNRYLHVCHHHLYSRVFTKRRTICCCFLLWVLAAMIAGPPLFGVGEYYYKVTVHVCTFSEKRGATYPNTMSSILMLGSTLIIGYFNLAIFRFWKRAHLTPARRFRLVSRTKQPKSEEKVPGISSEHEIEETTTSATEKASEKSTPSRVEESNSLEDTEPETDEDSEQDRSVSSGDAESGTDTLWGKGRNKHCAEDQRAGASDLVIPANNKPSKSSLKTHTSRSSNKKVGTTKEGSHMRQFSRRRRKQEARDKAIVRSLFVVFLLSLISFIPFGVLRVVESYQKISYVVDISFVLLLVFNCSVNWIVYGVMNRSFRRGYVRLLRNVLCKCW